MGLFLSRLSTKNMSRLTFHLWSLYRSGATIQRAFQLLEDKPFPLPLRRLGRTVSAKLERGETLAQALAGERQVPAVARDLIAVGEISGGLERMLEYLHRHYERRLAIQRKIIQILMYPILLIAAYWVVEFFKGAVLTNMPLEEYVLQRVTHLAWYLGTRLAVIAMTLRILDQWGYLRPIVDNVTARVPMIRSVFVPLALARFFRSLRLMLDSGVHVVTALTTAIGGASNTVIERRLAAALPAVQHGTPILEAVAARGVFPELVRSMLVTGEYAGKSEENLEAAAKFLEAEALMWVRLVKAGVVTLFILIILWHSVSMAIIVLWTFYRMYIEGVLNPLLP